MFHKFKGNRLNFGISYRKNRISRILHYKNVSWVVKIQPPPPHNWHLGQPQKGGRHGWILATKTPTNKKLCVSITLAFKTCKIPPNSLHLVAHFATALSPFFFYFTSSSFHLQVSFISSTIKSNLANFYINLR